MYLCMMKNPALPFKMLDNFLISIFNIKTFVISYLFGKFTVMVYRTNELYPLSKTRVKVYLTKSRSGVNKTCTLIT